MQPIKRLLYSTLIFFCLGTSCSHAEELRVGLAYGELIKFRSDGQMQVIRDQRQSESDFLPAGEYTLKVVEGSDYFRAAPLETGFVSATDYPTERSMAGDPPMFVELLRTYSQRKAERALTDAEKKLEGSPKLVSEGEVYSVQLGPYPNRYLADKARMKARQAGFPALVFAMPFQSAPIDTATPRRRVRLGENTPSQSTPLQPEMMDLEVQLPAPGTSSSIEMEPLPPLPPELLTIEPLPTIAAEELEPVPMPQAQKVQLAPAPSWRQAPAGPEKKHTEPRRIHPAQPRLPRPPAVPGRERVLSPAPRGTSDDLSQDSRSLPVEIDNRGRTTSPQRQKQYLVDQEPIDELPPLPPDLDPPGYDTEQFDESPKPEPTPLRRIVRTPPPRPFVGRQPQKRESGIAKTIKSIPIIRRFWWQKEIVGPPVEGERDYEAEIQEALQRPELPDQERIAEAPDPIDLDPMAPPPRPIRDRDQLVSVPPTPRPFDPDSSRQRSTQTVDTIEGYEQPTPSPRQSRIPPPDISSDLVPPAPGQQADDSAPLAQVPTPMSPAEEVARFDRDTEEPAKEIRTNQVFVPATGPVVGGYVQLLDSDGEEVGDPANVITIAPASSSPLEYDGSLYYGWFQAYAPTEEWLVLVNEVDLEKYVASVLADEINPDAPLEVLKTQAVLCRGYTMLRTQQLDNAKYGYHLNGARDAEWPYWGRRYETEAIVEAVQTTLGEVLVDSQGDLVTPVYCFASGGYVADAVSIWPESNPSEVNHLIAKPDFDPNRVEMPVGQEGFSRDERLLERWLTSSPDTYDKAAAGEDFRWREELSGDEMNNRVNQYWNQQVGTVRDLRVTKRAISGHATEMRVEGRRQTVTARSAEEIRQILQLESSLIFIDSNWRGDWIIYGGGRGHGVGLSQCGAIGLHNQKDANYKEILAYYFSNVKLGRRQIALRDTGV